MHLFYKYFLKKNSSNEERSINTNKLSKQLTEEKDKKKQEQLKKN